MGKECVWYNGIFGGYEVLDFDPDGLSEKEILIKSIKVLKKKYAFSNEDLDEVLETLYLIDTENLKKLKKSPN